MRHLRPLTTLLALSALAALALAPAHAMAVANNPSAGECRTPRAGDTVVLIGGQLCAVDQGSGGGGGNPTGTGALPGARQGAETIWVQSDAPRDPVVECFRNPARCLSHQVGGRGGRQEIDGDGSGSGGSKGGGQGSGKKAEAPKRKKAKAPTREDCEEMSEHGALLPSAIEEQAELAERIRKQEKTLGAIETRMAELQPEFAKLPLNIQMGGWRPVDWSDFWSHDYGTNRLLDFARTVKWAYDTQFRSISLGRAVKDLDRELEFASNALGELRDQQIKLEAKGIVETRRALRQCGATYDR